MPTTFLENTDVPNAVRNMSTLILTVYVQCSTLGVFGMYVVCISLTLVFLRQLQKQRQTLSRSENPYYSVEVAITGPKL